MSANGGPDRADQGAADGSERRTKRHAQQIGSHEVFAHRREAALLEVEDLLRLGADRVVEDLVKAKKRESRCYAADRAGDYGRHGRGSEAPARSSCEEARDAAHRERGE